MTKKRVGFPDMTDDELLNVAAAMRNSAMHWVGDQYDKTSVAERCLSAAYDRVWEALEQRFTEDEMLERLGLIRFVRVVEAA